MKRFIVVQDSYNAKPDENGETREWSVNEDLNIEDAFDTVADAVGYIKESCRDLVGNDEHHIGTNSDYFSKFIVLEVVKVVVPLLNVSAHISYKEYDQKKAR